MNPEQCSKAKEIGQWREDIVSILCRSQLVTSSVLAFSRDGDLLAVAAPDTGSQSMHSDRRNAQLWDDCRTVQLWDTVTHRLIRTLRSGDARINSIAFSGQELVGASDDGRVIFWNSATAKIVRSHFPLGSNKRLRHITFSPRSDRFAVVSDEPVYLQDRVYLFDANDVGWHKLHIFPNLFVGGPISFSRYRELAVAGQDVRLWNTDNGRLLHILSDPADSGRSDHNVLAVAFTRHGRWLASSGTDCKVRIWDRVTGQLLHILIDHAAWVRGVAFSCDGQRLASIDEHGTLCIWDVASGQPLLKLTRPVGESFTLHAAIFSADACQLVTINRKDGAVRLWNLSSIIEDEIAAPIRKIVDSHAKTGSYGWEEWVMETGHDTKTLGYWLTLMAPGRGEIGQLRIQLEREFGVYFEYRHIVELERCQTIRQIAMLVRLLMGEPICSSRDGQDQQAHD